MSQVFLKDLIKVVASNYKAQLANANALIRNGEHIANIANVVIDLGDVVYKAGKFIYKATITNKQDKIKVVKIEEENGWSEVVTS